jgi:hypothetical protein
MSRRLAPAPQALSDSTAKTAKLAKGAAQARAPQQAWLLGELGVLGG